MTAKRKHTTKPVGPGARAARQKRAGRLEDALELLSGEQDAERDGIRLTLGQDPGVIASAAAGGEALDQSSDDEVLDDDRDVEGPIHEDRDGADESDDLA